MRASASPSPSPSCLLPGSAAGKVLTPPGGWAWAGAGSPTPSRSLSFSPSDSDCSCLGAGSCRGPLWSPALLPPAIPLRFLHRAPPPPLSGGGEGWGGARDHSLPVNLNRGAGRAFWLFPHCSISSGASSFPSVKSLVASLAEWSNFLIHHPRCQARGKVQRSSR